MKRKIAKRIIAKRIMAGMLVATLSVLPCMFGYADDAQGVEISVENITENTNENTDVQESAQTDAEKYEANQNIEVMNVSVDPVQEFVRRLYENILNRPADDAGLQAWTNVLKSGTEQGAKVAQGFIDSTEFKSRALNDEEYLKILYRTFFDREPDSVGLEAWLRVLDSGLSRMHVFKGFAESQEFTEICNRYQIIRGYVTLTEPRDLNEDVTKFVVRCYRLCLRRDADESGLNSWCEAILSGKNTAKEVAYGFLFSDEFVNRYLSDTDYVAILYRVFMDREGDSEGLNAWVQALNQGKSRTHVFNGFADSAEFQEICSRYGISSGSGVWIGEADPNPNNSSSGNGNTSSGGSYEDSGSSGGNNNQQTISGTVYYTSSGSKYHSTSQCVSLKRSRHIYSTTLSKARAMGLTPCRNCYH